MPNMNIRAITQDADFKVQDLVAAKLKEQLGIGRANVEFSNGEYRLAVYEGNEDACFASQTQAEQARDKILNIAEELKKNTAVKTKIFETGRATKYWVAEITMPSAQFGQLVSKLGATDEYERITAEKKSLLAEAHRGVEATSSLLHEALPVGTEVTNVEVNSVPSYIHTAEIKLAPAIPLPSGDKQYYPDAKEVFAHQMNIASKLTTALGLQPDGTRNSTVEALESNGSIYGIRIIGNKNVADFLRKLDTELVKRPSLAPQVDEIVPASKWQERNRTP